MKSTGIIRRIDELGRVVIPKEIRRALNIRNGNFLEIFCEEGTLILKKFSETENVSDVFSGLVRSVAKGTGDTVLVCDREKFVCCEGSLSKGFSGALISSELSRLIADRKENLGDRPLRLTATDEMEYEVQIVFPISKNGEIFGGCALLSKDASHRDLLVSYAKTLSEYILDLLYE